MERQIYLVERTDEVSWDEYCGYVCSAISEEEARGFFEADKWGWTAPENVKVTVIGKSTDDVSRVILDSFKAG